MSALKFVTQTTIAYLVKFATIKGRVNRVVDRIAIVQQHKCASMESVNVDLASLERHSVVRISMNVRKNRVIRVHDAKMHQAHLDVFVPVKLSEIHTAILDVFNQINVVVTLIVLLIWLVCKGNVPIHALLHNVEEVLNANLSITKHYVIVLQVI